MRARIWSLLLVFLVSVAPSLPAQQQLLPTAQEASKLTQQDIPELAQKAEAGDAKAQLLLGHAYKYGYGTSKKETEAVKWYRAAADQGNADAEYCLGNAYLYGHGIGQDDKEAMKWFQHAAEQGQVNAEVNLGMLYYKQRNYGEYEKWTRQAAEAGDHTAQANLSADYAKGDFLPQDYAAAYMWILLARAAQCGDPPELCVKHDPQMGAETSQLQSSLAAHLSPELIAEARQKASDWLVAHQKEPLPPEGAETPSVVFMVTHKNSGRGSSAKPTGEPNYCYGSMTVSKVRIKYVGKNCDEGFEITPSNVKKVDASIRTTADFSRPFVMLDVKLVLTNGQKHTFVPLDEQLQKQDPVPLYKALKDATGK
jgi:TPR repeat protein